MRYILIDYARRRRVQKRGDGEVPVPLDEAQVAVAGEAEHLLAVDEALGGWPPGSRGSPRWWSAVSSPA